MNVSGSSHAGEFVESQVFDARQEGSVVAKIGQT